VLFRSACGSTLRHLLPPNPFFLPTYPTPTKKWEQLTFQSNKAFDITTQALPTINAERDSRCPDEKRLSPCDNYGLLLLSHCSDDLGDPIGPHSTSFNSAFGNKKFHFSTEPL
jgi:hypothetical protein